MESHRFSIKLAIPIEGRWASLEEHGITSRQLWDYYVVDAPDGEVLAGAILIDVDGAPWNSEEHSECFTHLETWLDATAALLDGETQRGIFAWEESGMEMRREGNVVVLEERTHHEFMQLKPICLDLREFAQALMKATASAAEVIAGLKNCAAQECGDDWRQLSIQWGEYVG